MSARRGEEYVVNRAMHLCNPSFSWWEIAQEKAWPTSSRSKTLFTLETCFQVFYIRICDRSGRFLVNCFKKIVMAANNSGFYSTYLLVSEERQERERRERHRARIKTGELAKRIQVENLCSI